MMSKMSTQGSNQNRPFKPKFIEVQGEDKAELIMARIYIKTDTYQTVEIDIVDNDIEADHSMDIIIDNDHSMSKITEEILEKHKSIEVKILGVNAEVALGTVILIEVGVRLEKDNF